MEFIKLSKKQKLILLGLLDYTVNKEGIVCNKKDNPIICPYTERPVSFEKASIMPGSTVVFNTSELTLAQYFSGHVEIGDALCPKEKT